MPTSTCELPWRPWYLKDFVGRHGQEMRFRLALFGAWHLADGPDGRRSVRKTLRDAYDDASKALHLGAIPNGARNLAGVQDLCRRGIVKLLLEGPPDWGDLVLGRGLDKLVAYCAEIAVISPAIMPKV